MNSKVGLVRLYRESESERPLSARSPDMQTFLPLAGRAQRPHLRASPTVADTKVSFLRPLASSVVVVLARLASLTRRVGQEAPCWCEAYGQAAMACQPSLSHRTEPVNTVCLVLWVSSHVEASSSFVCPALHPASGVSCHA